jgi:hypothetical protein
MGTPAEETAATEPQPGPVVPYIRWQALRLAVDLYAPRAQDDFTGSAVLHAADVFLEWLYDRPSRITLTGPRITVQGNPSHVIPLTRTGVNMAVTMSDGDQAAYTVSETDSKGFPVSGDTITWTESSGGTVVTSDGTSGVFVAVAPGTVTVTATDGTLTGTDIITVTSGPVAALVLGAATVTPQAAPAAPTA